MQSKQRECVGEEGNDNVSFTLKTENKHLSDLSHTKKYLTTRPWKTITFQIFKLKDKGTSLSNTSSLSLYPQCLSIFKNSKRTW